MKLPDFTNHAGLNQLRERMGALSLGKFAPYLEYKLLTVAEIEQLAGGGIDVNIDEIRILPDGTIAYKDSRILLYIRDVTDYYRRGGGATQDLPKFHVANCRTLEDMRKQKRFARYVVATKDNGLFSINRIVNNRITSSDLMQLAVCQNCLNFLSFDQFTYDLPRQQKKQIVSGFSIKKFFDIFPRSLIHDAPEFREDTAPLNTYPANWDSISRQAKARWNWTCKKCALRLDKNQHRRFLHVHHEDGQKWNIRDENLAVLCVRCHANENHHAHLKNTPDYKNFIQEFGP